MAGFTDLLSGGGTYGNSGSSGVSTPVTTNQGGIGQQSFTFGGNPNIGQATSILASPWPWLLISVAIGAALLWRRR